MQLSGSKCINMYTIKENSKLLLLFQLPKYDDNSVKYSPRMFIDDIFNDYIDGSLHNLLITRDLATEIDISVIDEIGNTDIMCITVILTQNGFDNKHNVVNLIFDRLENLDYVNETSYNNQRLLRLSRYNNNIIKSPIDEIETLSDKLLQFHYSIIKNYTINIHQYNSDYRNYVISYLSQFNRNNSLIVYISNHFDPSLFNETKYHKCKYKEVNVPPRISQNITYEISVPNKCIPTNLEIIDYKNDTIPILYKIKNHKIYIKLSNQYKTPNVCMGIVISSSQLAKNIESYILTTIFCFIFDEIVKKYLNCYVKQGLIVHLVYSNDNLILSIKGFNHKFSKLVEIILLLLISPLNDYEILFNTALNLVNSSIKNSITDVPTKLVYTKLKEISIHNHYTQQDIIKFLNKTKLQYLDLKLFIKELFKNTSFETLIQGNIYKEDVAYIIELFNKYDHLSRSIEISNQYIQLNENQYKIKLFESNNPDEHNNAIQLFFQLGFMPLNNIDKLIFKAKCYLLERIMGNHFFRKIRTEKKLGYIVNNKIIDLGTAKYKMIGMTFLVQSNSHDLSQINEEIVNFIKENYHLFCENLEKLDEYKESLIHELNSNFNNEFEEFNYNLSKIIDGTYMFDEKNILQKYIIGINKDDMKIFYAKYLLNNPSLYLTGIKCAKI